VVVLDLVFASAYKFLTAVTWVNVVSQPNVSVLTLYTVPSYHTKFLSQYTKLFTLCRAPVTLYRAPSHYTEILHKMQSMQSQFIIYKATSHYTEPHSHRTEILCAIKSSSTHYTEPQSHHTELLRTIKISFTICRHYTELLHNIQSPFTLYKAP